MEIGTKLHCHQSRSGDLCYAGHGGPPAAVCGGGIGFRSQSPVTAVETSRPMWVTWELQEAQVLAEVGRAGPETLHFSPSAERAEPGLRESALLWSAAGRPACHPW